MKKYDNYKDSGIEWIGDIPEHWNISKLKFNCKIFNGDSLKDDEKVEYSAIIENSIPYVSTKDIDLDTSKINYINGLKIPVENVKFKIAPKNSFLICIEGGSAGRKFAFVDEDIFFVNKLACFNSYENSNSRYLFFYIQSPLFQKQFQISMSGLIGGVAISLIRNFESLFPSIEEQIQIAIYLDHKTTQIDTLISKKQHLITLLQEERIAVINQAVTKGLDLNVPMKDSGIEWLGEIPEHWEVKKLKFVSKITRGAILRPVDEPSYFDDNGEWTYLNISDATICDKYLNYGKLRLSELGSTKSARVEPNNLIITASATIGKPFINKIPVCVHDGFIPITELKVNLDFLYNYFKNPQLFNGLGKSNTQKNIYLEDVKNLMIPIPNNQEQLQIAKYIEKEIFRIETLIAKSKEEIELLKEYKTALISEVVTGKVDVRNEKQN